MSKDTINLRLDAKFQARIFPDLYWLPVAELGGSRYSNAEIKHHILSKKDMSAHLDTPYELIQYLQICNFGENKNEHVYKRFKGEYWEIHTSGMAAFFKNEGSCASLSSLFTLMFQDKYEEVGSLCMISNYGGGHVVNYIKQQNDYYFLDLYAQINGFAKDIPIETGNRADFARTKYITGGCLKTHSIANFKCFFEKYTKMKQMDFIFYTYSSQVCPPAMLQVSEGNLRLKLPAGLGIEVLEQTCKKRIKYSWTEFDQATLQRWGIGNG